MPDIFNYAPEANPNDIKTHDPLVPAQYLGFRIKGNLDTLELCLVAEAGAPSGMGGVWKMRKSGANYAVYLVETSDTWASPIRVQTTTGTKSARLKT